ncbi:T9SS type A sorting domain-containing protein [Rufibacter sp. LB8]|uniref:T9SS type A sorting domain-containing protein n=1 Tax=Rufibacter sp. LB8 TaxID=2777781 RepID=UPI00178C54C4|nr:T9SS type A sorting domain-containing protein [Rufibacter sp. LB8]
MRLANATLKFTYDEKVLELAETPIPEYPRDSDNMLSSDDYFFHNNLTGPKDGSVNNGYSTLSVEKGIMPTGTNTDNKTYQITINNQLMGSQLEVNPSSNIQKFLSINDSTTIVTLKFKVIGSGYANINWLNHTDDYEVILLNDNNVDTEPKIKLTTENIYVQRDEDKYKVQLTTTGTGTKSNPIVVTAKSLEAFDLQAGSVGFYVYFYTANTSYVPEETKDLLVLANSFGWNPATIQLEELPLETFRKYTVGGSTQEHESYYNYRIKYISNAGTQKDDTWKPTATQNLLSLVFNEVPSPTKELKPIDIYIEAIRGDQATSTTFKDYSNLDHNVIEVQREFTVRETTLPVTLTSFTATAANGRVNLKWATASEKDNKEFIVERSRTTSQFEPIATVAGGGTSTTALTYAAVDSKPLAGTSYYRLKQIDFDGKFEYSKIITVTQNSSAAESITITSVHPNPFQNRVALQFSLQAEANVEVSLLDLNGKTFYSKTIKAKTGDQEHILENMGNLANGIYFIKVVSNGQVAVQKLVKSN